MSKYLFLGFAAIAIAAGNAAKAYADGTEEPSAGSATPDPDKPRRGRPPAGEKPPEGGTPGPTDEARLLKNKELIAPLTKSGKGEEVKAVIGKYSKTGLKDLPADNQAAFEKDIAALLDDQY